MTAVFNSLIRRLTVIAAVAVAPIPFNFQSHAYGQSLSERDDQLKFCATYIPCMIMVGIGDAGVGAITWTESLKNKFSQLFRHSTIRSPEEFRNYLDSLSPAERQGLVAKCTDQRGVSMRNYCENEYLNSEELSSLRKSKGRQDPSNRMRYTDERDLFVRSDERVGVNARELCSYVNQNSANPNTLKFDLAKLERTMNSLNNDPKFLENFSPLRSKALSIMNECAQKDEVGNWEFKPVTNTIRANEPWMNLPVRPGTDATVDKELKSALENTSRGSINQSDPFSGTSNLLSQEAIESERQKFKRDQESARAFVDLTLAVAQQALLIEQQKTADRLAAQQLARNQAEIARVNQNQRANSTQSTTVYYTQSNSSPQVIADNSGSQNQYDQSHNYQSESTNSSNNNSNQRREMVPVEDVTNCVRYTPRTRKAGDHAQWYELTNTCGKAINVWVDSNGNENYDSLSTINPGVTTSSWFLVTKTPHIRYVACNVKSNSGMQIHFGKERYCYHWSK